MDKINSYLLPYFDKTLGKLMAYILEAFNVHKEFPDGKKTFKALTDINLQIERGDIFGIIGSSGAGKSTLLRCLSSLETPSCGKIECQGKPLFLVDKRKLGMIFQNFLLLNSKTALENVCLPLEFAKIEKKEREKKGRGLLSLVGLKNKEKAYPSTLSGGEKQRVAIARALANNPEILFCDEPTSALDPAIKEEILDLLYSLSKKLEITLVLITHEMNVIRKICNKVAVMDKGKIIEKGTSWEVFSAPKDLITQTLLQNSSHELDLTSLKKEANENGESILFVKLHFKGAAAQKPILSHLISKLQIEVNILLGWIDNFSGVPLGSLTVGLKGEQTKEALAFLENAGVTYEVLS